MAFDNDDIFDNLAETEIQKERPGKLEPGTYDCVITACIRKRTKAKDDAFIVEFDYDDGGKTRQASWYLSLNQIHSEGNLKRFLYAACGFDPTTDEGIERGRAELDAKLGKLCRAAVSEKQFLAGKPVQITVERRISKENREYSYFVFRPGEEM